MNCHRLSVVIWSALIVVTVILAGCSQAAVASTAPEDVVDAFYHWYLGYPGNPMVDRAYHDSEYLTEEFKAEVDDILNSFTGGGYDPFLMAQDIPEDVTVQNVSVDGNEALVTVSQGWAGGFTRELEIELQLVNGEWLISGIVMPETPTSEAEMQSPSPASPQVVVQDFYTWYLDYVGGENRTNPLVDGAWRSTGYLTERFVVEMNELLASSEGGGYDPFLCAQDIPTSLSIVDMTMTDEEATAIIETSFAEHRLAVDLKQLDGRWYIDAINCPVPEGESSVPDPAAIVRTFYRDYLSYSRDRENPSNPLVDGTYRTSPYLTPELVTQIDELIASFEGGAYDPFLCAQDLPDTITVGQPIVSDGTATVLVETNFEGHSFQVDLAMGQDGWKIAGIGCGQAVPEEQPSAEAALPADSENTIPADWQVMRDEAYGFEIWYPADWAAVEIPLRDEGPENSMVRMVSILPAEWAAKMNQGGPPDPNNNIVAPVSVEVSLGNLEEYRWLYYEMPLSQEIEINGATVVLEQDEPSDYQVSRYLFQHPTNSDLRITLVDYLGGFSDRAAGNEAIVDTLNRIVTTFSFTD